MPDHVTETVPFKGGETVKVLGVNCGSVAYSVGWRDGDTGTVYRVGDCDLVIYSPTHKAPHCTFSINQLRLVEPSQPKEQAVFKLGDMVEIIELRTDTRKKDGSAWQIGDEGKVTEIDTEEPAIRIMDASRSIKWLNTSGVKLIKEQPMATEDTHAPQPMVPVYNGIKVQMTLELSGAVSDLHSIKHREQITIFIPKGKVSVADVPPVITQIVAEFKRLQSVYAPELIDGVRESEKIEYPNLSEFIRPKPTDGSELESK